MSLYDEYGCIVKCTNYGSTAATFWKLENHQYKLIWATFRVCHSLFYLGSLQKVAVLGGPICTSVYDEYGCIVKCTY